MSKHNDVYKIGDVYGSMLNNVKRKLVAEGKVGPKVKPGEIGDVPLTKGGPSDTSGYMKDLIDKKGKKTDDNLYNIDDLSQDEEVVNTEFTKAFKPKGKKVVKEDRETPTKVQKIAQKSLNNFMKKKSIFDKLYENVMSGGGPLGGGGAPNLDNAMDETDELDALGIEGEVEDELGGEGEEVTFTLDRDTAQKLIDVLQAAIGGGEEFDMEDTDMEDMGEDMEDEGMGEEDEQTFWDEDEEELGHAGVNAKEPNMGKNNKVGNLKVQSGQASSKYTDKVGNDGDYGHAGVNAKQPNMGKNNKVGTLKQGKSLFEQ